MRFIDGRLLLPFAVLAVCAPLGAQERAQAQRPLNFGYEGLRIMLQRHGLEPVSDVRRWRGLPPSETVVVVMGHSGTLQKIVGNLTAYARAGGAVLAASDHAGEELGIAIGQGPVTVGDATLAYRTYADCPLVLNFRDGHALLRNVTLLATNRPGYFLREDGARGFTSLAWLPAESRAGDRPIGAKPLIVERTFAGSGRMVLAADHSLFTNQMLLAEDNLLFAWNCASWLCESKERKYLVFVEDGRPVGELDAGALLSGARPPIPPAVPPEAAADLPPESLVVFTNALVAGLEDEDVFNALAERQPRGVHTVVFRRAMLLTATCLLAAAGAAILLLKRGDRAARPLPAVAAAGSAPVPLDPRGELAGLLAVQFFREAGADVLHGSGNAAPAPPRIETQGSLLYQWRLGRRVKRLWKLATRQESPRMNPLELEQLAAEIIALQRLQSEGRLRVRCEPTS